MGDCVDLTEDSPVACKRAHDRLPEHPSHKKLCNQNTPINQVLPSTDDDDDDIIITKEDGEVDFHASNAQNRPENSLLSNNNDTFLQVATRDFPHSRPDCAVNSFSREPSQTNASCCSNVSLVSSDCTQHGGHL